MTDQNAPSGDPGASENDPAHGLASRFPTAYTILFLLIILKTQIWAELLDVQP